MGNNSRKYSFEVERRAYRLTDFTESFELPYRPCQFLGSRFQFFEQPHVLDGDDSLSSKGLDQSDLIFSKWPDLMAMDRDRADQLILLAGAAPQEVRDACLPLYRVQAQCILENRTSMSGIWTGTL